MSCVERMGCKKMHKIAIIGAGQLGSRHLQSLTLLGGAAEIQVVDPNAASRETAAQRFAEVASRNPGVKASFHASISDLTGVFDIAIVAANSDVRRQVIEQLLAHCLVNNLILEKVLFQRLEDYDYVEALLKTHSVKAWVNCPRREWPFYRGLKKRLAGKRLYEVNVGGSSWGLGCNAIHLIDLIAFLTENSEYTLSPEFLDTHIVASKRPGFIEFTGVLNGKFADGPCFSIASYAEGNIPEFFAITGDGFRLLIIEAEKNMLFSSAEEKWQWKEETFDVPYQSNLTNLVVERILKAGECDLPTLNESALLHKPVIAGLLAHLQKAEHKGTAGSCPIT